MRKASWMGMVFLSVWAPRTAAQAPVSPDPAERDRVIQAWLDEHLEELLETYRHVHAHPELSLMEKETAALVAERLRSWGYQVTDSIGGHGVVGVLKNDSGPTLMIRGDMDALPITEETGLPYASQVRVTLDDGRTAGVMHACGHDVHVTNLLAVARFLSDHRSTWKGTLVILAQPAEELGRGARLMIEDGLFERIPKPDFCLALHVTHLLPAGQVAYTPGWATANVDSVDIDIFGRGGHGARPHETVDPIVAAAHVVTALQTLVSRRVDPAESAVVTVGSIHGGATHNVIPDKVSLQLTVRSFGERARQQLLTGIEQITRDVCRTFQCPKPPAIRVDADQFTPAGYNDPELAESAARIFKEVFGEKNVHQAPPVTVGEDFARYAQTLRVPGFLFWLGSVDPGLFVKRSLLGGEPIPPVHSGGYAPAPEPTLRAGARAMIHLASSLLQPDP